MMPPKPSKFDPANVARRDRYARNPEIYKNLVRTRRQRVKDNGGVLSDDEWLEIKRAQNHKCADCGKRKPLTQDHIKPLSMGGKSDKKSIRGLCKSCNSVKTALKNSTMGITSTKQMIDTVLGGESAFDVVHDVALSLPTLSEGAISELLISVTENCRCPSWAAASCGRAACLRAARTFAIEQLDSIGYDWQAHVKSQPPL